MNGPSAEGRDFDLLYKILLIGDTNVGKTCFLFRYCDESFTATHISTIGIDFKVRTVTHNGKKIKLQIWDTAGQERFRTITTAYYRGALGFLILYDITNEDTFNNMRHWMDNIDANASSTSAQMVLVGNKCDAEELRTVSTQRGQELADERGVPFFETSAKESININEAFHSLVVNISEKISQGKLVAPTSKWNKGQVDVNKVQLNESISTNAGDPCAC